MNQRKSNRHHFTQRFIDKLVAPTEDGKQKVLFDESLPGFGVQLSGLTVSKIYIVQKDIFARTVRRTVAHVNELKLDKAREVAGLMLLQMRQGIDPKPRKIAEEKDEAPVTLEQGLERYLKAKTKLRDGSISKYRRAVRYLGWGHKPMCEITRMMVEDKFWAMTEERGPTTANDTFVALRAIWLFMEKRSPLPSNPCFILADSWHDIPRRTTIVPDDKLATLYTALDGEAPSNAAYVRFLMFTGMRKNEARTLRWADINFNHEPADLLDRKRLGKIGTITIPPERHKSGNRTKTPFVLPMSREVRNVLIACKQIRENDFVFPGWRKGEPVKDIDRLFWRLSDACGMSAEVVDEKTGKKKLNRLLTPHALRRTFLTASTNAGVHVWHQKALLNHSSGRDVTAGYNIVDMPALLKAAQMTCDYLSDLCGVKQDWTENVVGL
ncbi:integrase [Mesorhizobium tianshanense]|uniref:Site-specific recombinase XerD n=1 Tax=Mesorhizobium tianshanense TaxID=39844 RepID=A0A562NW20_9HYPH|nr:tyrosine-type recombinase/integrase [Mesorhizobium tianshanense]TWI36408.1 site-specific recombinase XerD [Mesorhizobium tianshanense]GLS36052.1 integrase [Mesorhizobium tianshanense]